MILMYIHLEILHTQRLHVVCIKRENLTRPNSIQHTNLMKIPLTKTACLSMVHTREPRLNNSKLKNRPTITTISTSKPPRSITLILTLINHHILVVSSRIVLERHKSVMHIEIKEGLKYTCTYGTCK